jgi:hypothetical protein
LDDARANGHIAFMANFWIAQLNIAKTLEPLDSPRLADFVALLAPINALAEQSPGFVWRLKDESDNALGLRILDDPRLVVNLTVWTGIELLADFVHRTAHAEVMRRRRAWFEPPSEAVLALWWIPEGATPTLAEAEERLVTLRREGPTPRAFNFATRFPPQL